MGKAKYATREHRAERKRWAPVVEAGDAWCAEVVCLMDARWIEPGSEWDMAHARGDDGYLGPAHARCNRSEGATRGNRDRGTPYTSWAL